MQDTLRWKSFQHLSLAQTESINNVCSRLRDPSSWVPWQFAQHRKILLDGSDGLRTIFWTCVWMQAKWGREGRRERERGGREVREVREAGRQRGRGSWHAENEHTKETNYVCLRRTAAERRLHHSRRRRSLGDSPNANTVLSNWDCLIQLIQ